MRPGSVPGGRPWVWGKGTVLGMRGRGGITATTRSASPDGVSLRVGRPANQGGDIEAAPSGHEVTRESADPDDGRWPGRLGLPGAAVEAGAVGEDLEPLDLMDVYGAAHTGPGAANNDRQRRVELLQRCDKILHGHRLTPACISLQIRGHASPGVTSLHPGRIRQTVVPVTS